MEPTNHIASCGCLVGDHDILQYLHLKRLVVLAFDGHKRIMQSKQHERVSTHNAKHGIRSRVNHSLC